jgi:hypothetical protein
MNTWHSWLALIGGLLALVNHWWGAAWYFDTIGGVLALVAAIGLMTSK